MKKYFPVLKKVNFTTKKKYFYVSNLTTESKKFK